MKGKGSESLFSLILGNKLGRGLRKAALACRISSGPELKPRGLKEHHSQTMEANHTIPDTLFKAHKPHPNPTQQ